MIVFFVCIVVVLIGFTTAAVMGRIGGFMAEPTSSQAFSGVPAGSLSSDDLGRLRFDQGLRGYRMDQVDEVIDVLGARLRELETEVASLAAADGPVPADLTKVASLPAAGAPVPADEDSPAVSSDGPRE